MILSFLVDCCRPSQTGEEQLKGIINWPQTLIDVNATVMCPYKINDTIKYALRLCKPDFVNGPQFSSPEIDDCPYKTVTTRQLEGLSKVSIDMIFSVETSLDLINKYLRLTRKQTLLT